MENMNLYGRNRPYEEDYRSKMSVKPMVMMPKNVYACTYYGDWSSVEIDMLDENSAILSHYNIKCNSMETCYGCCHRCLQIYKSIDDMSIEVFDYLFRICNRQRCVFAFYPDIVQILPSIL